MKINIENAEKAVFRMETFLKIVANRKNFHFIPISFGFEAVTIREVCEKRLLSFIQILLNSNEYFVDIDIPIDIFNVVFLDNFVVGRNGCNFRRI